MQADRNQLSLKFSSKGYYYEISPKGEITGPIILIQDEYAGDITKGGTLAGTEEFPYQVNNVEDLVSIGQNRYKDKNIVLMRDLNISSQFSYQDYQTTKYGDINEDGITEGLLEELTKGKGFKALQLYTTTFDGKNHNIKNFYMNTEKSVALFDRIQSCTIKNVTVTGNVISTGWFGAGLISEAYGKNTIKNCKNYVNVQAKTMVSGIVAYLYKNSEGEQDSIIENCVNYGNIVSTSNMWSYGGCGGIAGNLNSAQTISCQNYGKIEGQYSGGIIGFSAELTSEKDCTNYGEVIARSTQNLYSGSAGGIVGYGGAKEIINCVNYGEVTVPENDRKFGVAGGILGINTIKTTKIQNSFNQGKIYGAIFAGGIVGQQNSIIELKNCYSTGEVISKTAKEIIGKSNLTTTIQNVYYRTDATNAPIDNPYQEQVTAITPEEMKSQEFVQKLNNNRAEHLEDWKEWSWKEGEYPCFQN